MSPRSSLIALWPLAALLAFPPRAAAQEPSYTHLFPRRATITSPAEWLVRLPLPAEVIVRARPDLSDVRVFDANDAEVPYLIDRGDRPLPPPPPEPITRALPIEASRQRARVLGIDRYSESFDIGTPGSPPPDAEWVLRIESASQRFVSSMRITTIDAVDGEHEIANGSFYRLGAPRRERLEVVLPGVTRGRLRVVIEGQDGYLEPTFTFVARRTPRAPSTVAIPLAIAAQRREGGRTVLTIDRPPGIAPERVAIETATASFVRPIEVRAIDADTGERTIGSGTVLRVEGVPGAEALELEVGAASGARIEIWIDDGDSPALEAITITAIVRQPSLVFEGRSATRLRFGGGRVRGPRYDLQSLFGSSLGEALLDGRLDAELGPIEDEPEFDPRPALAFAMRAGATVSIERFTSVAAFTVPDAREGLSYARLGADVLAATAIDLSDLRVVGDDGRQWPYLFSEEAVTIDVPLTAEGPLDATGLEAGWSRYRLVAPVSRVAPSAIELDVASELVDREVRVLGRDANDTDTTLGSTYISRRPGDASPLVIELYGARSDTLELQVRDGDEAPLVITSARARLPSRDLYVTAPPGTYRMLAGDPSATLPDYEMSRARALILAVDAVPATIAPMTANPRYRAPSVIEQAGVETIVMWAVLIGAVLVLGLLTLRIARTAPGGAVAVGEPASKTSPADAEPSGAPAPEGDDDESD